MTNIGYNEQNQPVPSMFVITEFDCSSFFNKENNIVRKITIAELGLIQIYQKYNEIRLMYHCVSKKGLISDISDIIWQIP